MAEEAFDFDAYQSEALVTASTKVGDSQGLSMGSMGLAGESSELFELFLDAQEAFLKAARTSVTAGKLVDYLKKVAHHEHKLDKDKVKKELGDLLWYMAVVAHMADLKLSDVAKANVLKLRARYGTAFDPAKSQERKAGDT